MLGFIKKLYSKIYITLILEDKYADIHVVIRKMGKTKKNRYKRFEIQHGKISSELRNFIEYYERRSPFSYLTVLNTSIEQSASRGCSGLGMEDEKWLCISSKQGEWSVATSKRSYKATNETFKEVGIDFLFSPFIVLDEWHRHFKEKKSAMYVLVLSDAITLAIFKNGVLEFAKQSTIAKIEAKEEFELRVEEDEGLDESLDFDLELDIDEDDVQEPEGLEDDLEEIETLEGLDDLDELDELDNLDEINALEDEEFDDDVTEFIEDDGTQIEEKSNSAAVSKNYKRYNIIKEVIHEFYQSTAIEDSFIERVYVYDPFKEASEIRGFLEDELFVEVEFDTSSIHQLLMNITKQEIYHAT